MRLFILALFLLVAGCAIQPLPDSNKFPQCRIFIDGKCYKQSASEQAVADSRGHSEEPKNDKMMYYVPPEQLWPEDFPTKPQVCGSPFTGRLISR